MAMANNFRRPMVITNDHSKIEAIPYGDYIQETYLDGYLRGHSIMAEILIEKFGSDIPGVRLTQDYPHRGQITKKDVYGRRVDNLVQGPVEIAQGSWKLGYAQDTESPDLGTYVAYVYEIPQSAVTNNQLAIDYFRTRTQRDGVIEYIYEGTGYFTAPGSSPFRLYSAYKDHAHGNVRNYPDPANPRPADTTSIAVYFVPRKLKSGEQPQKVITTSAGHVTGDSYFAAIDKSPLSA